MEFIMGKNGQKYWFYSKKIFKVPNSNGNGNITKRYFLHNVKKIEFYYIMKS